MKVSEPSTAYNASNLQRLKEELIASIDATDDEKALKQCLMLLQASGMPCVYTDAEFKQVLELSEAEGLAAGEEVEVLLSRWKS